MELSNTIMNTNYYHLITLDYIKFSNMVKDYILTDSFDNFMALCDFLLINKQNYITLLLSDDNIIPCLSSKYYNLLMNYTQKKITLRNLFEYFNLPIDKIKFSSDENFNPINYEISSCGDLLRVVHYVPKIHEKTLYSQYIKYISNKGILDVVVNLHSFIPFVNNEDIIYFEFDDEDEIQYRINNLKKNKTEELYNGSKTTNPSIPYVYENKQIAYLIYKILQHHCEIRMNFEDTDREIGKELDFYELNKLDSSNSQDINTGYSFNEDKSDNSVKSDNSDNLDNLDDIISRPILILVDEPDSNTKLERLIKYNENKSIHLIYNYKKEDNLSLSDILLKCSKILTQHSNNL